MFIKNKLIKRFFKKNKTFSFVIHLLHCENHPKYTQASANYFFSLNIHLPYQIAFCFEKLQVFSMKFFSKINEGMNSLLANLNKIVEI